MWVPRVSGKRGARELERASSQSYSARNCDIYPVPRRFPVARQPHSHRFCASTGDRKSNHQVAPIVCSQFALLSPDSATSQQSIASYLRRQCLHVEKDVVSTEAEAMPAAVFAAVDAAAFKFLSAIGHAQRFLHEPCVLIAIWASAAGVAARRARWCHWRSPSRACFAHVTCLLSNCLAPVPLSSSLSSRIDREGGYLPSRMARLLVPRPCTALLEFCFLLSFRVVFGMVYEFVCRIW